VSTQAGGPDRSSHTVDDALRSALLASLEDALSSLRLERVGDDRFRAGSEGSRFGQAFGGQLVAQALLAAALTVEGKDPASLHAYFAEAGDLAQPLELTVGRARDGRSMSTRRVDITQGERSVLVVIASFHANTTEPELAAAMPAAPPPEEVPLLQHWVRNVPPELEPLRHGWLDHPPPLEMRIGEPPSFMGDPVGSGPRAHWMRLPGPVREDSLLHTTLLTYASDYLLLDMAFRAHPERTGPRSLRGTSLDHTVWFHRPVRFDRWHLYTQEALAISGDRGLVRGTVHNEAGQLVATTMQEVLVRPARR
jgi:acyl-CoA thioesterase II